MDRTEAEALLVEAKPPSIERAVKLLKKAGVPIEADGTLLLKESGEVIAGKIEPDPLHEAGMRIVAGRRDCDGGR